jgi:hypothetical protein
MMRKNNSRAVGNAYERQIRLEFIELGWKDCQTSRYASKETDDKKVDLVHTEPFNVQIKRWSSAPAYQKVLSEMPDTGINIIIHKKPNKGEVVVMEKRDFYYLLEHIDMLGDLLKKQQRGHEAK